MNLLVGPQLGFRHKAFVALGARKRALSRVHALMFDKIRLPDKALPAVIANKRLDAGVGEPMFHQGALLSKTLPALGTRKRLHARMGLHVSEEISFPHKTFPALGTPKRLFGVGGLVPNKIHFLCETFFAHGAFKWRLVRVKGFQVVTERRFQRKTFGAFST